MEDPTQERIKGDLPSQRQNLQQLEMQLSWMRGEIEKLVIIVERQRGMIMEAERLSTPELTNGEQ